MTHSDNQLELFSAIFTDIACRDARETMEAPFLSLSKSPRFKPIKYQSKDIEILVSAGEPHGIASIFDWDLIIWLLSQIRQAKDLGQPVSRKVGFSRRAYLKDARRHASGDEYRRLESTIARLKHTTVTTTIRAQNRRTVMFNWLEFVDIERDEKGYLRKATAVLPEWLFKAACDHKLILTLHRDYFLLTGGIERWLYRLIRKGAGRNSWTWSLRSLHVLSGTTRGYKYFAADLRKIASRKTLLDYELSLVERRGVPSLSASRRQDVAKTQTKPRDVAATISTANEMPSRLRLQTATFDVAKRVAVGYDVYFLEQEWRRYNQGKEARVKNPDAAFVAFCRKHASLNPIPAR